MTEGWKTQRGDEYWFSNYWCTAEASFNSAFPGILTIEKIRPKGQRITASQLLDFLSQAQRQFDKSKIILKSDKVTLPLIETLKEDGQLAIDIRTSLGVKYAHLK